MRGIPKKLATREDVYNAAMDLPPDTARQWLAGLIAEDVAGLMSAEELAVIKSQVAALRWPDRAVTDRRAAIEAELSMALVNLEKAQLDHARAVSAAAGAGRRISELSDGIQSLRQRLDALGELDAAITDLIDQTLAHAKALFKEDATAARKAAAENQVERLNSVLYLKGARHGK